MSHHALVVWLLTDNKPGHRNQLRGLGNRLQALANASVHWISADEVPVPGWRAALGVAPCLPTQRPQPSLIIAAGSRTHRLLLALRRLGSTKTVVLMKPSFPLVLVSAAIIPEHDGLSPGRQRLLTKGALNAVTPSTSTPDKLAALILLGGPSRHFDWDTASILNQVSQLIERYPNWHWTISSSRRTPYVLRQKLQALKQPHVAVKEPEQTDENWLSSQLAESRAVWVTPDSMSMVCEAATSGAPTGLFQLPARHNSRVAKGIQQLIDQHYVATWDEQELVMTKERPPAPLLWEADRAARWLLHSVLKGLPL